MSNPTRSRKIKGVQPRLLHAVVRCKKWKRNGEVRLNDDGTIDEIVLKNAHVHLEQMSNGHWWMGLTVNGIVMHVQIFNKADRQVKVTAETDDGIICEGFAPNAKLMDAAPEPPHSTGVAD